MSVTDLRAAGSATPLTSEPDTPPVNLIAPAFAIALFAAWLMRVWSRSVS